MPTTAPAILAFDSAADTVQLALSARGRCRIDTVEGGQASSTTLLPAMSRLLDGAGLRLRDLDALAFNAGPGSFTGVRTAVAVAQAVAYAIGLPLIPLNSLMMLARASADDGAPWIAPVIDARMNEVYYALYERRPDGGLTEHIGASVAGPEDARQAIRDRAGSAWATIGATRLLRSTIDSRDREVKLDGRMLIDAASAAYREGVRIDPADAQPLYVRDKVALTTAERKAARSCAA